MTQQRYQAHGGDDAIFEWVKFFSPFAGLIALVCGVLTGAAALVAKLTGERITSWWGSFSVVRGVTPGAAFGFPVTPWHYWIIVAGIAGVLALIIPAVWLRAPQWGATAFGWGRTPVYPDGVASATEIRQVAGDRALLRKARVLRPSIRKAKPTDVGLLLGTSRGVPCWSTVEDSVVVLGSPRSGKGFHLVIPAIMSAPGAVIATSTRPDNLVATLVQRSKIGPVAVFDPQHLIDAKPAIGISPMRWSPIRGCENPQVAMIRARGFAAGTGKGVTDGDFWAGLTAQIVQALLHAAALDDRPTRDLYRWSLDPAAATEAIAILEAHGSAASGWSSALEGVVHSEARQTRDSAWAGVRQAFAALADPRVLEAVSPEPGEGFDPEVFLRSRGTLHILATASGAAAAGAIVAAFIEDVVEASRRIAATSPGGRLDPPLALVLDEVANISPLPSLPSLVSEGGGSGITTYVVLQSLAQARSRWGAEDAQTIWDAAIVKVVLGGGGNADDLRDLSALVGERDETTTSVSRSAGAGRSTSESVRRVAILPPDAIRTLPFGRAILLHRAARPIILSMIPWTKRHPSTKE